MCVYNGEAHLREAVESILEQTFKDFELVIVEDGSTDSTWEILNEYAAQDSRIVLSRNDKNLGLERSLNRGLAMTRGEYFARQDADDISLSNRLELQTHFLDTHPKVGALGTAVEFINEEGICLWKDYLPVDHESLRALFLINNFMHHSTLMARRTLMQDLGGYNVNLRYAEDYDLWWRLSRISRLANLPNVLLKRRIDDGDRISNLNRKEQLQTAQKISARAVKESLERYSLSLDEKSYEKFWWTRVRRVDKAAYQKFWSTTHHNSEQLQIRDIQKLQPLWIFLSTIPAYSQIWGIHLCKIAYDLLLHGQMAEGITLFWIVVNQLKLPPQILIQPLLSTLKFHTQIAYQYIENKKSIKVDC